MKRVDDFKTTPAAGGGWFKIWHDGYSNGEFCVERLRRNNGMMEVTIPQDLAGYLLAPSSFALPSSFFSFLMINRELRQ